MLFMLNVIPTIYISYNHSLNKKDLCMPVFIVLSDGLHDQIQFSAYVTGPTIIDYVSANYTKLYFC